jgi:hypothetical protein
MTRSSSSMRSRRAQNPRKLLPRGSAS